MVTWRDDTKIELSFQGKRILVCGINYWPEESGNAPYTTGLAEHLFALGADVTVLAGMPYYPTWTVNAPYSGQWAMTEHRNGVVVKRLRQYVPKQQSAVRRAITEISYMAHVINLIKSARPDGILCYVPMVSGAAVAAVASMRHNVPFGVIIQDLSGLAAAQTGVKGGGKVSRITNGLEGVLLRRAASVAIVAEGFRPHVEAMGVVPEKIMRVRNWTHISQPNAIRLDTRVRLGIPEDAWVALHAGNMGLKQGLENIIDTARLAKLSGDRTLFVLVGDGNQRTFLREQSAGLDNLLFFPPQPEAEFGNVLACADVLLVNQKPTVVDMCLPGKLTSYLAVGRPVVAAVAPMSDTAIELNRAHAGIVVPAGQPPALLAAINALEHDPCMRHQLAQRGKAFALQHLTADSALHGLEGFLTTIVAGSERFANSCGSTTQQPKEL